MTIREKLIEISEPSDLFSSLTKEQKAYNKLLANFAVCIAKERKMKKMTQKEFAKYMKVSQGMISRWESGEANLSLKLIAEIYSKLDLVPILDYKKNSEVNCYGKMFEQNFVCISNNKSDFSEFTNIAIAG